MKPEDGRVTHAEELNKIIHAAHDLIYWTQHNASVTDDELAETWEAMKNSYAEFNDRVTAVQVKGSTVVLKEMLDIPAKAQKETIWPGDVFTELQLFICVAYVSVGRTGRIEGKNVEKQYANFKEKMEAYIRQGEGND